MPASGKFEIFSVAIILQTLTPNKWIHNSCILKTCWAIIRPLTNLPNSTNSSHNFVFSSPDRSREERGDLANKDNERDDYDDNDKDHLENTRKEQPKK